MGGSKATARISPDGYYFLVELHDTNEAMLERASKFHKIIVLKQWLASQLGINSIYNLKNDDDQYIFDNDQNILKPFSLFKILYIFLKDTDPWAADEEAARASIIQVRLDELEGVFGSWVIQDH